MSSGLAALLDDVAAIAKLAAASIDDVGMAAAKAGSKAAGVVIDDTAVTPRYVTGFTPDRELPIIWRIAVGSVRNKILILLPAALLLSAFAPWAITPLLMVGGAYLCFEGAEKALHSLSGHHPGDDGEEPLSGSADIEKEKIAGAIRTDLILSAEIMAIALAEVADKPIWEQAIVLILVALAVTAGVYGVVGLIVKMDDIGLHLAKRASAASQAIGRLLVIGMPSVLGVLATVGTAAMIWVGGGIIVHGLDQFGFHTLPAVIHDASHAVSEAAPFASGLFGWLVSAIGSGIVGFVIGCVIALAVSRVGKRLKKSASH